MQGWRWRSIRGLRFVARAVDHRREHECQLFLFLDLSRLARSGRTIEEGTDVGRQDVTDEVLYFRSAGLDLGKRCLLACVRVPNPKRRGTWSLETERFGTTPAEVRGPRRRPGRLKACLLYTSPSPRDRS